MKKTRYYTREKLFISSTGRDIKILIYRPTKAAKIKEKTPAVLWIHGGGYATGFPSMVGFTRGLNLVKKYGAVLVSVGYRLSTEAPYPAALEDCYSALKYVKDNHEYLGINPDQIMVGGESAGGGLTVALSLYARDKGEVNIAYQMPIYPMIDDRDTPSSANNKTLAWNTKRNHKAWDLYLGELRLKDIPIYAAPARCIDYSNLPPCYTFVGDKDAFLCETLEYVKNLTESKVEARVDVYNDVAHAFDFLQPFKKVSKAAVKKFEEEFEFAVNNYFARQKM